MKPTISVLFAGGGGDTLGFVNAGFELVYANDNNKSACETLRNNFNTSTVHHGSIIKQDVPYSNVISGGFPCQGFSVAGPRKIDDSRNKLYKEMKRVISTVKPDFFMIENVKGFVTMGDVGKFFNKGKIIKLGKIANLIINEFVDIGYNVQYKLFNVKNFGLPQDRERIIIVGVRNDIDYTFRFPKPTGTSTMDSYGLRDVPVIDDEIYRESNNTHKDYFSSRYMSRNRIKSYDDISYTIPADARNVPPSPECIKMWDKDIQVSDKEMVENFDKYKQYISKDLRRMSWMQCACIQGFPSNYEFAGDIKSKYRQIGNAVPPILAQKIGDCIMPYYMGEKESYCTGLDNFMN